MELTDALRTTGAVREFTDRAVDDAVLARVLETARFAPSGGNAQAWRVVVVKDSANRRRLRDCYLRGSREYMALLAAGLRPWAPTSDRDAEARALAVENTSAVGDFAEQLRRSPSLARAVRRPVDVGGGGPRRRPVHLRRRRVPLPVRVEHPAGGSRRGPGRRHHHDRDPARSREVKALLGARDPLALAAVIALGYPVRHPRRLRRQPVSSFATVDSIDGPTFGRSADEEVG